MAVTAVGAMADSTFALLAFFGELPTPADYADAAHSLLAGSVDAVVLTLVAVATLRLSPWLLLPAGSVSLGLLSLGLNTWADTGRPTSQILGIGEDSGAAFAVLGPTDWLLLAIALSGLVRVVTTRWIRGRAAPSGR